MSTVIPAGAYSSRGGQVKSKAVLQAWAEHEPEGLMFQGLETDEQFRPHQLPNGAQLGIRGNGGGQFARVTITGGNGFRVS